jgi:enediyne polyketide synthase
VWERWDDLQLRRMEAIHLSRPWAEPLLSAYLERRLEELMPATEVVIALNRDTVGTDRSERALAQAFGRPLGLQRRADGKPVLAAHLAPKGRWSAAPPLSWHLSAAHAGEVTLVAAGPGRVGCDIEPVSSRSAQSWEDLLGAERCKLADVIAHEAAEDTGAAATRVWVARECLKKAGAPLDAPLALAKTPQDGWVLLASGSLRIATFVAPVGQASNRLAVGVLADLNGHALG